MIRPYTRHEIYKMTIQSKILKAYRQGLEAVYHAFKVESLELLLVAGEEIWVTPEEFARDWVWADGSPCGVKI